MSGFRKTHGSLMISLIVHGIVAFCLFFFLLGVDEKVGELLNVNLFEFKRPDPPKPRPRISKPIVAPQAQQWQSDIAFSTTRTPDKRSQASRSVERGRAAFTTVSRFTNEPLVQGVANSSSFDTYRPSVSTVADLPSVDLSGLPPTTGPTGTGAGLGVLGETSQLGGKGGGTGVGRGEGGQGSGGVGGRANTFARAALSVVSEADSTNLTDALSGMAKQIRLGNLAVEPLPQGEPGGQIVGKGRDIRGVVRFVRLQHRLADWWIDASSLTALVHFMNSSTNIRTDMNVEGGAPKLTDPGLMKSPIAFMTGHDPALSRRVSQLGQMTGATARRFTDRERMGLRKYLLAGGMLFYDDCGLNSREYPLMRIVSSELRSTIPEYSITKIPNDHELYDSFYPLGGPAWGVAFVWRHGPKAPIRDYLEGVSIDGRLAVILSGRDYLCAAQTVQQHAGKVHKFIPAYRMLTNAVVYALAHGSISDHGNYVPISADTVPVPKSPPQLPMMP